MTRQRRTRRDIQVGNLEKKNGLDPGTIRNVDGSDSRSDKELGTLRDEFGEQAMEGMLDKSPNPVRVSTDTRPDSNPSE